MDHRRIDLQLTAAAKAGISERSGRRIDRDPTLPSQRKKHPRGYRTRANPFEGIWEAEIVPLVRSMPSLQAITILRELQRRHPGAFRIASCAPCSAISGAGARSPGLTATSSSARSIRPAHRACQTSPMRASFA